MLSHNGGVWPRWSRDGKEILFRTAISGGKLMSARVTDAHGDLHVDTPVALFDWTGFGYDMATDGRRFLAELPVEESTPNPFTVVLNWPAALKR